MDQWETLVALDASLRPVSEPLVLRASVFHSTLSIIRKSIDLYPYAQQQIERDSARIQKQLLGELYMVYYSLDIDSIHIACSNIGMDPAIISILIESRENEKASPDASIRSLDVILLVTGVVILLVVGYYSYHRFSKTCKSTLQPASHPYTPSASE
jgi:hypothetical protein